MLDWTIVASNSFDQWAYGAVKSEADLYDPRIWGATRDLACACGKFEGASHVGIICDHCGVKVSSDASEGRRTRMGKIELGVPCRHPLDEQCVIDSFPVAPIALRTGGDGRPNLLGKKYEHLVAIKRDVAARLPPEGTTEYYHALRERRVDIAPVRACLQSIVGVDEHEDAPRQTTARPDSLLQVLFHAIPALDRHIDAIVRSMGCEIRLSGTF